MTKVLVLHENFIRSQTTLASVQSNLLWSVPLMPTIAQSLNKPARRLSLGGNMRRLSFEKAERSDSLREQLQNLPGYVHVSRSDRTGSGSPIRKSSMKHSTQEESIRNEYGRRHSSMTEKTDGDTEPCTDEDEKNSACSNLGLVGVRWDRIEIREYGRTVGDNPSVSGGPPLTLSWQYRMAFEGAVDAYEDERPDRRVGKEMAVPRYIREIMLCEEWGCTNRDIANAVRDILAIKQQRRTTLNRLEMPGASMMEENIEKIIKGLKKGHCGRQREILQWDDSSSEDSG